jgi:hypothetical protein
MCFCILPLSQNWRISAINPFQFMQLLFYVFPVQNENSIFNVANGFLELTFGGNSRGTVVQFVAGCWPGWVLTQWVMMACVHVVVVVACCAGCSWPVRRYYLTSTLWSTGKYGFGENIPFITPNIFCHTALSLSREKEMCVRV